MSRLRDHSPPLWGWYDLDTICCSLLLQEQLNICNSVAIKDYYHLTNNMWPNHQKKFIFLYLNQIPWLLLPLLHNEQFEMFSCSGFCFEGYLIPPHPPVQPTQSNVFSLCIQSLSFFFSLMLDSWLFLPSFPVPFSVSAPPPSLEHTLFFIVRDDSNDNNAKNHNSQPKYEKETERQRERLPSGEQMTWIPTSKWNTKKYTSLY